MKFIKFSYYKNKLKSDVFLNVNSILKMVIDPGGFVSIETSFNENFTFESENFLSKYSNFLKSPDTIFFIECLNEEE